MNIASPMPKMISHQGNPIVEPSGDTKVDRAQPPTKKTTTASPVIILRRAATVNATAESESSLLSSDRAAVFLVE